MGGMFGSQRTLDPHGPSTVDYSLRNQTFSIQGHSYTMIDRLGGGAFGSVWSAVTPDGRQAAVKMIDINKRAAANFDPRMLMDSFTKEIKMAYKMRQENHHVVTIYGFDFHPQRGLAMMAMELGGDSLKKRIEKLHSVKQAQKMSQRFDGRDYIPSRDRKNIWVQLVNIVLALHQHHVIHRDMKPDNLVFFGPTMKIVDLGIAQKEVAGYDPGSPSIGTPLFSAPECFVNGAHVTSKADIWSAGAILYNMTYGIPPVTESSHPPPGIHRTRSAMVDDVLRNSLQRNSDRRGSHLWLAQHPYTSSPALV